MNLGKQMLEQLRMLAADGPETLIFLSKVDDYHVLALQDATQRGALEFFDYDRYSITLRTLAVGSGTPAPDDARAYLSAHAAEIARRMSYLEEPLAVWELDGDEHMAQLRSSPPQREGEETLYWEVTLQAGPQPGARLTRYRWLPGMPERELVAYPATFALIARMLDSLSAGLDTLNE
jgi:hypothetical protein